MEAAGGGAAAIPVPVIHKLGSLGCDRLTCAGSSHIARSCTEGASEGLGDAALRIIRKHFIISNSANAKQDRPS